MEYHRLLNRQIKKYLSEETLKEHPKLASFIHAINESYQSFDQDKKFMQRSFDLADEEYFKITSELTKEKKLREKSIQMMLNSILTLQENLEDEWDFEENNLLTVANFLHNQVTLRKEVEDKLKAAIKEAQEAVTIKSNFLSAMSHEIRTPMNGIIGTADLLLNSPLDEEQRELLNIIRNSGETLLVIINDILDFSKIESGKLKLEFLNFSLIAHVEQTLDLFGKLAREKGLDLLYFIEDNVPKWIVTDPTRLSQILSNLVSNAIKFTSKGEVFIHIKLDEADADSENKFRLHFSVKDTGIGIPEHKLKDLFNAFEQVDASTSRKYGGSGLGLSICRRLCFLMGGSIWVESQFGQGSNFQFNIEVEIGLPDITQLAENKEIQLELKGKRVLIVDDNPTNLKILQKQMAFFGLIATASQSQEEAIELVKSNAYDLFILDYLMPETNGLELAQAIREVSPAPILLVSSSSWAPGEEEMAHINQYLTKPLGQYLLLKTIEKLLRTKEYDPTPKRPSQNVIQPINHFYPFKILVAEDYPINQKVIAKLFSKLGYDNIAMVENGEKALEYVTRNTYDLVFMDLQMPQMSGFEATSKIRSLNLNKQPIIIALTANALLETQNQCIEVGMNDFLTKPIKIQDLRDTLEKWVERI